MRPAGTASSSGGGSRADHPSGPRPRHRYPARKRDLTAPRASWNDGWVLGPGRPSPAYRAVILAVASYLYDTRQARARAHREGNGGDGWIHGHGASASAHPGMAAPWRSWAWSNRGTSWTYRRTDVPGAGAGAGANMIASRNLARAGLERITARGRASAGFHPPTPSLVTAVEARTAASAAAGPRRQTAFRLRLPGIDGVRGRVAWPRGEARDPTRRTHGRDRRSRGTMDGLSHTAHARERSRTMTERARENEH